MIINQRSEDAIVYGKINIKGGILRLNVSLKKTFLVFIQIQWNMVKF